MSPPSPSLLNNPVFPHFPGVRRLVDVRLAHRSLTPDENANWENGKICGNLRFFPRVSAPKFQPWPQTSALIPRPPQLPRRPPLYMYVFRGMFSAAPPSQPPIIYVCFCRRSDVSSPFVSFRLLSNFCLTHPLPISEICAICFLFGF